MDWLTFISDMVAALAWPAAAVVIVVIFRTQMAALISRVTKVTTPIGSIDAEAREAKRDAQNLPEAEAEVPEVKADTDDSSGSPPPASPPATDSEAAAGEPPAENPLTAFPDDALERARRLAVVSPAESVEMTWRTFKESAARVVEATKTSTSEGWNDFRSPAANLAMWGLGEEGLDVVKSLHEVATAVDASTWNGTEVSKQAALDFNEATQRVLRTIFSMGRHPSRTSNLRDFGWAS